MSSVTPVTWSFWGSVFLRAFATVSVKPRVNSGNSLIPLVSAIPPTIFCLIAARLFAAISPALSWALAISSIDLGALFDASIVSFNCFSLRSLSFLNSSFPSSFLTLISYSPPSPIWERLATYILSSSLKLPAKESCFIISPELAAANPILVKSS